MTLMKTGFVLLKIARLEFEIFSRKAKTASKKNDDPFSLCKKMLKRAVTLLLFIEVSL